MFVQWRHACIVRYGAHAVAASMKSEALAIVVLSGIFRVDP